VLQTWTRSPFFHPQPALLSQRINTSCFAYFLQFHNVLFYFYFFPYAYKAYASMYTLFRFSKFCKFHFQKNTSKCAFVCGFQHTPFGEKNYFTMFHTPYVYEIFYTSAQLTYVQENQVAPAISFIKLALLGILSMAGPFEHCKKKVFHHLQIL
jgi:hypothetical protein